MISGHNTRSFASTHPGKNGNRKTSRSHQHLFEKLERRLFLSVNWTSENNFDSNTLALYHFNETSGTTAVNAQGNTSRNLTLSNSSMITSGTDFLGRASNFLNANFGTATSAAQAIPTDWNSDLTISFWMKSSDTADAERTPVWLSNGLGWANEAGFAYHPNWSTPYHSEMANVNGWNGAYGDVNTRLLNGAWHHVAVTHNGASHTAKFYIDNVLLNTWNDSGGANLAAGAALYIGQGLAGANAYIDELLVQKGEITDFSNAYGGGGGTGFSWTSENNYDANTLALYHFNETSGTTAANAQGNTGRNLTLSSSSMVTSGADFLGRTSNFLNANFGTATSAAQAIPTDWTQGLTISFWMKSSDQSDASRTPVWLSDGLGWLNEAGFAYHPTWSSPYRPKMRNVSTMYGDIGDIYTRLLNGAWHHVAVTHRPSDNTARLYIDNNLITSWSDAGGTNLTAGAAVYLGQGFTGANAYIDELLIQKGELTNFSNAYNGGGGGGNHLPVANNDSYSTNQDTQLIINPSGVLSNDTDQDGDPLTAIPVGGASHGSVSLNSNGGFTYMPTAGYYGADSFTYKANDTHGDSNIATVNLTVYASGLGSWPDVPNPRDSRPVLVYDQWAGPYMNPAGQNWVNTLDSWYTQGSTAGLTQDTFRSYDGDHSSIRYPDQYYPQIGTQPAITSYYNLNGDVFGPRVTFGVQSFGSFNNPILDHSPGAMVEANIRQNVNNWYSSGSSATYRESWYEQLYRNNFLLIQPAVQTYLETPPYQDKYTFLTDYYLQSIGHSGSDADLMKPIIFAASALPPAVKTRALRSGVYVPLLMYLFKSNITGNLRDAAAHQAAYTLPAEAWDTNATNTPFLNGMINAAHSLTHVPPVAKISVESVTVTGGSYSRPAYYDSSMPDGFTGAVRQGETMEVIVNLSPSWTDSGYSLSSYYAAKLRGAGTVTTLSPGRYKISVPWTNTGRMYDNRSDFLLLANDGTYDSAPLYVSIKHIQSGETSLYGVGSYGNGPMAAPSFATASAAPVDSSSSVQPTSPSTFSTVPIKPHKDKHHSSVHDLLNQDDGIFGTSN